MNKIRVLIADKRDIFRQGLAEIIKKRSDIAVAATVSTGFECIEKSKELIPDIVLLDTERYC